MAGQCARGQAAYERAGLIDAWWFVYVSAGIVRLFVGNGEGAGGPRWGRGLGDALPLVAGILAFWVVTRVTERQEAFVRPASADDLATRGPPRAGADAARSRLRK